MTIAGSDSSGGAGVQADLKTFHAHGVYGMSAITALTAQNTRGVDAVFAVPATFVTAQIDTTVTDIRPHAVKTGMLPDRETVEAVVDAVDRHSLAALVVDPVWVATSGDRLADDDALSAIRDRLFPSATIVTPNVREAAALADRAIETEADMAAAAKTIVRDLGAPAALVKGGDLAGDVVVDVLFDGHRPQAFREPRIRTSSTHGSGCALAASIAARLARGAGLEEAVVGSRLWVRRAIERAPGLGDGHGPLDLGVRDDEVRAP